MASSTEDAGVKDLVQREVDTEIKVMNDFLTELDYRKHYMSHFVSGLQVAVRSILSAAHAVKKRHPQERKKTVQVEKEGITTQPCPKVEEVPTVEEEQKEDTLTEDEADGSPSSELMKSLNSTLGDLEEAEKLIEIDSRDHMSITDQSSGDSCYLEFMYEFIADLRQKLQQSCEEFMSMESQTLALLEERKALQDLHFQLANSPKKTVKPAEIRPTLPQKDEGKDTASTDTSATLGNTSPGMKKNIQQTDEKDSPSKLTPLPKFVSTSSTTERSPDDNKQPTQHNVDEYDYVSPIGMRKLFDQYSPEPVDISPDTKKILAQTNDKDFPSDITPPPKDVSTSSTAEGSLDAKKQTQQIVDDEFDYVSPLGMRRMFGSFSQEPKIFSSPNSPSPGTKINLTQTDDKDTPSNLPTPTKDTSASSIAEESPDSKKQSPEQIVDDEYDFSPFPLKKLFGLVPQESKMFLSPPSASSVGISPVAPRSNLEVSPGSVDNES